MSFEELIRTWELARQLANEQDIKRKQAPGELAKAIIHVGLSKEQIERYSRHPDVLASVGEVIRGIEPPEAVRLLSAVVCLAKALEQKEGKPGMEIPEFRNVQERQEQLEGAALEQKALELAVTLTRDSVNLNKLKRLGARIAASRDHAEVLTHLATFYPRPGVPKKAINDLVRWLPSLQLQSIKDLFARALIFLEAEQVGWHLPEAKPVPEIERLYTVRRPDEVWAFLRAHPELVPLLKEAYQRIQKHFPDSPVALEVIADPEAPDDRDLWAFIQTTLPPEEALEQVNRFDEEWWLAALDKANGKLGIDVEYR